jgi:surfeit locus 1 family protein
MSATAPGPAEGGVRRFPIGLTAAAVVCLAALVGLGAWQMWWRLPETEHALARIAALQHEPPRPVNEVLAEAARGVDVSYIRVAATCAPPAANPAPVYRYAVREGEVGWRLMGACRLTGAPWPTIALDRGLVDALTGGMAPRAAVFSPAAEVVGVLRLPGRHSWLDAPPSRAADGSTSLIAVDKRAINFIARPKAAPYYLAVEKEVPPPPGVSPAALPEDIPNNHLVYALTWFGLAGVLIWMWAAFVIRRMRGR